MNEIFMGSDVVNWDDKIPFIMLTPKMLIKNA
jgi:hypothetical protein